VTRTPAGALQSPAGNHEEDLLKRHLTAGLAVVVLGLAFGPISDAATAEARPRIYFGSLGEWGDSADIRSVRPDGTGLRHFTERAGFDNMPSVSPSGCEIAYVSDDGAMYSDLVVASIDGSQRRILAPDDAQELSPSWSPDGDKIVYSKDYTDTSLVDFDLVVAPADGGKETRLTHTDSMETGAAWSPSGKSILGSSARLISSSFVSGIAR
jgi:Tol biopolymer transport system component